MDIVLASDDKFVQHCCVTITSILYNNKDVTINVITEGLKKENETILKSQTERLGGRFNLAIVNKEVISTLPMPQTAAKHISPATYYRLFVAEILPATIDKIIYLDCDIIVRGSLQAFWDTDIAKKPIAAVYQDNRWAENTYKKKKTRYQVLDMDNPIGYFNAGSLLMNLKYWRENDIQEKLMSFLNIYYEKIVSHDQDVLNGCLYKDVVPVSDIWNFRLPMTPGKYGAIDIDQKQIDKIRQEAIIIHFVNRPKPWEFLCSHPFAKEYYEYLDMTIYSGWRPRFKALNVYLYSIRPILVAIKHVIDRLFKLNRYNPSNY